MKSLRGLLLMGCVLSLAQLAAADDDNVPPPAPSGEPGKSVTTRPRRHPREKLRGMRARGAGQPPGGSSATPDPSQGSNMGIGITIPLGREKTAPSSSNGD